MANCIEPLALSFMVSVSNRENEGMEGIPRGKDYSQIDHDYLLGFQSAFLRFQKFKASHPKQQQAM